MLSIGTVSILMSLGQSAASGRPADWKAESLVVAVRKADELVERARLNPDVFSPKPQRNPRETETEWGKRMKDWDARPLSERYRQPYVECVTTLEQTLCAGSYHVGAKVVSAVPGDDGTLLLTCVYDQRTKARTFFTPEESDTIRQWDERKRTLDEEYTRRVEYWQRHNRMAESDPARDRPRQLREYETGRELALREVLKASAERERMYKEVTLRCTMPAELASSMDTKKLLSKKSVKLLFEAKAVELQEPNAEAGIPATVSLIHGNVLDIERSPQSAAKTLTP